MVLAWTAGTWTGVSRLLAGLVLAASLHGAAHALVRPLFQLSDEMGYFAGAQLGAQQHWLADDSPLRLRVAPPDGAVAYWPPAGKPAFRIVAGGLLAAANSVAAPPTAAILVRVAMALSLPLATLFTALLARELFPRNPAVCVGAPAVVALHPVYASFAAAVSPDAFCNAFSALALWLIARFALRRSRPWEPLAMLGAVAAAVAFKDTAFFLAVALIAATIVRGRRARRTPATGGWAGAARRDPWLVAVPAALLVPAAIPMVWRSLLRSPYLADAVVRPTLAVDVLRETAHALPGLFRSFWTSLGNFGAQEVDLPAATIAVAAGVTVLAAVGLGRYLLAPAPWEGDEDRRAAIDLVWIFAAAGTALLIQPAIRQVLMSQADEFQGRWMFPVLPALAVYAWAGLTAALKQPSRALPLGSALLALLAVIAVAAVLVPHFYGAFPSEHLDDSLYLRGSYGAATDLARIRPLISANAVPGWLTVGALAGFLAAALVWAGLVCKASAGASPAQPREIRVNHHPH